MFTPHKHTRKHANTPIADLKLWCDGRLCRTHGVNEISGNCGVLHQGAGGEGEREGRGSVEEVRKTAASATAHKHTFALQERTFTNSERRDWMACLFFSFTPMFIDYTRQQDSLSVVLLSDRLLLFKLLKLLLLFKLF